jgi:WXG100 family type VII secretion target
MDMSDQITYNYAAVGAFASDVGQRAAQLMEIHQDILQRTQALADYFMGKGATAFFDAQQQMLHGLEGLIQTVSQHSHVVNQTADSAHATDIHIQQGFV